MGKTISIKVLFGIYLLLMAGKVFAFSCNVDGGSSIGAGTTSVYVNLDPVIQPGQNLVVDLSQHISCWNDYGGWYDTDHINLVQGSAFAGSLQSYKGSLYWNNVTYPFPLTTNTNVLDIGDKTPMPLPLKLYITPVGAAGGVVIKAGEVIARIHMYKIATLGSGNPRNFTWNIISNNNVVMPTGGCTVDSRNVTVDLPDFPGSAEIPLGVYCSSEQKLSFYLSGATTDSSRQVFANTAPDAETFLPELFQNHGYYTAAVGKWHLSKISNVPVPEDKQTRDYHDNFTTFSAEEWQPQNRGFDYFMGFHAAGTAYYNSPSLFKNRERVPAKGYISDQLTDEAIGVVDRAKTLDQPFMLYLAYNAPHLPNDNPAPDQYQKQFNTGSQTADNYYASVYSVDQGVKRILEQLKKNGQYDNTIILFTSDNGAVIDGPLPLNGAQKGYKSQTYPGGTHTPMFMWWKGKLQPGNYDKLISAMDFYPTALDAADISIPKDLKLDGVSLLPWLQDKKQGEPHKNLTWITSYSHWFDEENIPFWDNYHKFVRHQSDDYPHNPNTEDLSQFSYTVRNNDYSLVYTVENNQLGLYKLTDLQQKDNLAAANPQVVKEMQGVVREFIDSSQPPLSEVNQEKFNNIKKALSEAK